MGSFGPRAQAVVGYLTGRLRLSHRGVVEAVEALHGLDLSLGSVSIIQDHVSRALEQPVRTAQQYVHQQPVNHVDETVWPEGEKQKWLWIDATPRVTVFRILVGRGQAQAKEVIGKGYQGIINTDRYPGYHWMDAHLRRTDIDGRRQPAATRTRYAGVSDRGVSGSPWLLKRLLSTAQFLVAQPTFTANIDHEAKAEGVVSPAFFRSRI